MTDMDKIQKDNAEPGKAPDKMSADKLHLFATQYALSTDGCTRPSKPC